MSETFNKARQAALANLQSIRDALVHVNDGKDYFESEIAQLQSEIWRVRMEQRGYKAVCDSAHNLVNTLRDAVVQGLIPDNDGDHLMAELAARKIVSQAEESINTTSENLGGLDNRLQDARDKLAVYTLECKLDKAVAELMRTPPGRATGLQREIVRTAKEVAAASNRIVDKTKDVDASGWRDAAKGMLRIAAIFEKTLSMRNMTRDQLEGALKKIVK
jgi:predicted  nucleic acid-binding Zn-ribbon protein